MPYTFNHLTIRIVHHTISVHLSAIELTFIDLIVVPSENSVSVHFTVLKGTCIFTRFCFHFAVPNFKVPRELSNVFTFSVLHEQSAMALHVSVAEWTDISLTVCPFECGIVVIFNSIDEFSLVS